MESTALNQNADCISNNTQLEETKEVVDSDSEANERIKKFYEDSGNICEDHLLKYQAIEEQRLQKIREINTESRLRSKKICKQKNQKFLDIEKERNLAIQKMKEECNKQRDRLLRIRRIEMIQNIREERERQLISLVLHQHQELKEVSEEYKQEMKEKHDREIKQVHDESEQQIQQLNQMALSGTERRDAEAVIQMMRERQCDIITLKYVLQKSKVNCKYERQIRQHYEACGRKMQTLYSKCEEEVPEIVRNCKHNIIKKGKELSQQIKDSKECSGRKRERYDEIDREMGEIKANNRIWGVYEKCSRRLKKLRKDCYLRVNEFGQGNLPTKNKYEERNFDISVVNHECNEQIQKILDEYVQKNKKMKTS